MCMNPVPSKAETRNWSDRRVRMTLFAEDTDPSRRGRVQVASEVFSSIENARRFRNRFYKRCPGHIHDMSGGLIELMTD